MRNKFPAPGQAEETTASDDIAACALLPAVSNIPLLAKADAERSLGRQQMPGRQIAQAADR